MTNGKKILFYDLETSPMKAWVWSLGKQYVGHGQLTDDANQVKIICMAWCWNDGKKAKVMDWGDAQDDTKIVKTFDRLASEADIVIGKNSDRFDNKVMNTRRMFLGLPSCPDWIKYTDDLEKQIRKHFRLASNSLDYFSQQLGLGGKDKMQFTDWVDIVDKQCPKALKKMKDYNKKDTEDLRDIWEYCEKYVTPKFKPVVPIGYSHACVHCGSTDLIKRGTRRTGKTTYQEFKCRSCFNYAGRIPIKVV